MLGRPAPRPGEGLLLTPCSSVHMYGMRFPLDVAFLDRVVPHAAPCVACVLLSPRAKSAGRGHGVRGVICFASTGSAFCSCVARPCLRKSGRLSPLPTPSVGREKDGSLHGRALLKSCAEPVRHCLNLTCAIGVDELRRAAAVNGAEFWYTKLVPVDEPLKIVSRAFLTAVVNVEQGAKYNCVDSHAVSNEPP